MTPPQPKDVIVYDGQCRFCQKQVERIRRWDSRSRFEYVPRQTPGLDERFPQLAQGDFNTGMRLIGEAGSVYVGADAVYQIATRLPRSRWIAWVYRVPVLHQLARGLYAWVAKNRQSLGGSCEDGACQIDHR